MGDAVSLARFGLRDPAAAVRDLPPGWDSDPRWTALLEKVGSCADPDAALRRLVGLGPRAVELALEGRGMAEGLVRALGFSEYVAHLFARTPGLASELLGGPPVSPDGLLELKDCGLARIAVADLAAELDRESFVATGRALAHLGDACLEKALGPADGFAVLAMGKYGGRELNYASDIDVLFVCRDGDTQRWESVARELMSVMNGPPTVFRTDADLRPEGRDGPLVRSMDSYLAYYKRWAKVWEFQSLVKCRPAAGDAELGREFMEMSRPFVWPETFGPEAIEQVRALKSRAEHEVERRGLHGRQVKLGRGGIRDVEFAVQLLQLVHGRHHPELRTPNTLEALDLLGAEGFVAPEDARGLADAYVFLRHTEHRLQLVAGRRTHTLPTKPAQLEHLARGLGFRDEPDRTALEGFEERWRRTIAVVRRIHEQLFYRPLLEAFGTVPAIGPTLPPDEALERLAALGFDRPPRARDAIASLTSGTSRSPKVMRASLPALLAWLAETPDPDAGLGHLAELAPRLEALPHLLAMLRDEPPVAQALCRAVGTGSVLARLLERDPSLVAALSGERPTDRDALVREAAAIVSRSPDVAALRSWKEGHWLALAVRGLGEPAGRDVFVSASRELSWVADACLEAALDLAVREQNVRTAGPPPSSFAVVGMGRLGGEELSHSSDLDVMFVYEREGSCPDGTEGRLYFTAVAERVIEILGSVPPVFRVDAELRPEGRSGPIVRSLEAYREYYERWAQTWEFQALIRARHSAGDHEVTQRLLEGAAPQVFPARMEEERVAEVRRMKARIERERVKAREDPRYQLKLGVGGLADVEFTVQLMQMRHGHAHAACRTPNTLRALRALADAGAVDRRDSVWLLEAYLLLNRVRNHLFLLRGLPTDVIPSRDEDVERLARSLGYGRLARSEFLEDYRRATRRARQVCDRLFYGEEDSPEEGL